LFTVVVELDILFREDVTVPQPSELLELLTTFYNRIETASIDTGDVPGIYYKAAVQATNDKVNRLRRATIISGVLRRESDDEIMGSLRQEGLV
jgi:hypothetical protein